MTTLTLLEAARAALDAMKRYQVKRQDFDRFADEITNLRDAIEATESAKPVAMLYQQDETGRLHVVLRDEAVLLDNRWHMAGPLYLHPPEPARQPMTDAEINQLREMLAKETPDSETAARRALDALPSLLDEVERLRRDGFDSRHPVAQSLIGRNARLSIALDIVRDILADDCEQTPIDAEHWSPIHDQVQAIKSECSDLRDEIERLRAALEITPAPVTLEAAEWAIDVFKAEDAAMRADAARYRWLRDHDVTMHPNDPFVVRATLAGHGCLIPMLVGDEMDTAIDAAMQEQSDE